MAAMKTIQVCGDLLLDFSLLRRTIEPAPFHSDGLERVELRPTHGGAWYLADVLRAFASREIRIKASERPDLKQLPPAHLLSRAYQTWERFRDAFSHDKDAKVWRVRELMGCAVSDVPYQAPVRGKMPPSLLVIDDLGLGFANRAEAWPEFLRPKSTQEPSSMIVIKASGALTGSALWTQLQSDKWRNDVTAVLPARLLRERGASLPSGLSWDRSLDDLDHELVKGISAADLGRLARVVVVFQDEAAAVYGRKPGQSSLTFERVILDPNSQEGAWKAPRDGRVFGGLSLMTAVVARHLVSPDDYPLNLALARGLAAGRRNHELGGGTTEKFDSEGVLTKVRLMLKPPRPTREGAKPPPEPMDQFVVFRAADRDDSSFGIVSRGEFPKEPEGRRRVDLLRDVAGDTRETMLATAMDIVLRGPDKALRFAPKARYGKYLTADREEIESINAIRNLILSYLRQTGELRPLSIAVFGSPGCGKSFAVKQLIETVLPKHLQKDPLVFNMTGFRDEDDLAEAFHQIRDVSQSGLLPLVFWDEFDCKLGNQEFGWLKSFLAPMQDSEFCANGRQHPLGRALFIFAGGVCHTIREFSDKCKDPDYSECKISDFLSRLRGSIDIKGPNPPRLDRPEEDAAHVLRRALILHFALKQRCLHVIEQCRLASDVISALLRTREFRHGARSIESLVAMCQISPGSAFTAASLPSAPLMALHVADSGFDRLLAEAPLDSASVEYIAEIRHEAWCEERRRQGWKPTDGERDNAKKLHPRLLPYNQLKEEWKEDNRRPARLTHDYLIRLGFRVRRQPGGRMSPDAVVRFEKQDLGALIDHEHTTWMRVQWLAGHEYTDDVTTPHLRLHHDLRPTSALDSEEGELDRSIIESLPQGLKDRGWEIVKAPGTSAPNASVAWAGKGKAGRFEGSRTNKKTP